MSTQGERGDTGDTGDRGVAGERGAVGATGEQGATGAAGATSSARLERRVTVSFVGIVIIAFAIASFHTYQLLKLRDFSHVNRDSINRLKEVEGETAAFRRGLARQTAAADIALCRAIEGLKSSERDDVKRRLAFELRVKPGPELTQALLDASIRGLRARIQELQPVKIGCHALPSQKSP